MQRTAGIISIIVAVCYGTTRLVSFIVTAVQYFRYGDEFGYTASYYIQVGMTVVGDIAVAAGFLFVGLALLVGPKSGPVNVPAGNVPPPNPPQA